MKRLAGIIFVIPLLAACIGKATPPQQIKMTQAQNEVIGKFAREVGERELNILLRDSNDPTLPGIPVGDLLYILTNVNEDRLIQLVQGVGATTVLELLIAMKRVGCTRANTVPIATGYGFDARSIPSLNGCKWQHLHLPNIMVQLLQGASANGMTTLIDTLKHSYTNLGLAANKPLRVSLPTLVGNATYDATVQHYSYLMKLAYVVVGFDTPTSADPNLASPSLVGPPKLFNLMNLAIDGRDMVFLIDMLDKTACPGASSTTSNCTYVDASNNLTTYDASGNLWSDIASGFQMQETQNLLEIMRLVTNTTKMATLINGYRTTRYNLSQDEAQVRYFVDRLRVVLEHIGPATACPAPLTGPPYPFPTTVAYTFAQRDRECALQNFTVPQGGNAEWNLKLATIINLVTNINRMMDFVYQIDDGYDALTHIGTTAFPNRGIDNLMVMVNNINPNAAHPGPNTTNNELTTAAYLIDNVPLDPANPLVAKRNRISYLAQYIGTTYNVLQLSCYDGVADAVTIGNACYKKGLINQVASGSKVNDSGAADLTAAGQKLTNMMGQVTEIEDMRFIIRKVDMTQLNQLVAGLLISGTFNTANLINQISGYDCWDTPTGPGPGSGILSVTMVPGAGVPYTGQTTLTFTGGGTAASGRPLFDAAGRVAGAVILTEGDGYVLNATPAITILDPGGGTGSTGNSVTGRCVYNAPTDYRGFPSTTSTGALGLGKMVNIINYLSGNITNLVTLINNITDGQKLGILINGISRSSNLVGITNAIVDTTRGNNATINDMITLLNTIGRVDTYKLVHMMDALGDATESPNNTAPALDHDNVAQLLAPYSRTGNLVNNNSGVGGATMATLVSSLNLTGGGGFVNGTQIALVGATLPVGANAVLNVATVGGLTGTRVLTSGSGCSSVPTVTVGGAGSGAIVVPYMAGGQVQSLNIVSSGTGYTTNPVPLTITGGGCSLPLPTAEAYIDGIGTITVLNPGTPAAARKSATLTVAGPYAAVATVTVSGTIATLSKVVGGTGFSAGPQTCPIVGAGGTGGSCTLTVTGAYSAGGSVTGCTLSSAGSNYASGKIVRIGGQASAYALVAGNAAAGLGTIATGLGSVATPLTGGIKVADSVSGSGCGYAAAPAVSITGCGTNPAATAIINGSGVVTDINVTSPGSACGTGVKVTIGESPYAYHIDGITAQIDTVNGGVVTGVSVSDASVNAAQLVQMMDRDGTGTGISQNYRVDDTAWVPQSACSTSGYQPKEGPSSPALLTLGTPGVVNWPGHGLAANRPVVFSSTNPTIPGVSGLPTGITPGTVYYVSAAGGPPANTFEISAVIAGPSIAFTVSQSGTQTVSAPCISGDTLRPNISARETMVRLLHHGVTPTTTSSKSYFNGANGIGPGTLSLDWPGVGPQYIAGAILNNVSVDSTQTLISMINSDVIGLEDTVILLGCGDRSTYSNGWTTFTWQQMCEAVGPGIW